MYFDSIMLCNAFSVSLSVGASICGYTKDLKKSLCYFAVVFLVFIPLIMDTERYKYAMLFIAVTVFLMSVGAERKKVIDALYTAAGTMAKFIMSVLFFTNLIVIIFPLWVNSASYNITVAALQFAGVIIISHFEVEIAHFKLTNKSKTFSVIIFTMILILYGGIMPLVANMPFTSYYSAHGFFTALLIPVTYYGAMYISRLEIDRKRIENNLRQKTVLYENMNDVWKGALKDNHFLAGLFGTSIVYVENNDFEGFKEYFYKQLEPEINREPQKVIKLDNIQVDLIRNLVYFQFKQAKGKSIPMDIEVAGVVTDFGIENHDLQKVLSIYFDNALEACVGVDEPRISLVIERNLNSVNIALANRFDPAAQKQDKSLNRGHGLSFAAELLGKYDNVIKHTYIEGDTFTQKITMGVDVDYDDSS